jgi:hypothetical protein
VQFVIHKTPLELAEEGRINDHKLAQGRRGWQVKICKCSVANIESERTAIYEAATSPISLRCSYENAGSGFLVCTLAHTVTSIQDNEKREEDGTLTTCRIELRA